MEKTSRKEFIRFMGAIGLGVVAAGPLLSSCFSAGSNNGELTNEEVERLRSVLLQGISPSSVDELVLPKSLRSQLLISWTDELGEGKRFGFNNDYIAFLPDGKSTGLLWVNHESIKPLFVSGPIIGQKTKEQVDIERRNVGGSLFRVEKIEDQWTVIKNHTVNKRVDAFTPMAFNWDHPVADSQQAIGTHSNCSGGVTPWGTILSCEENYNDYTGEYVQGDGSVSFKAGYYQWEKHYNLAPEHYGWVIEIDPKSGQCQKHVALGRFMHECCKIVESEDGRVVAYMGDDEDDRCLYKFIGKEKHSLKNGTLYVANTEQGKWIPIDYSTNPILQQHFSNQTDVLIHCRRAAELLGGTPLDRPEDIEIDPFTGDVIVALTNNKPKGNYHGSLLKIKERNADHSALEFQTETLISGGSDTGFSCPDNLLFDKAGNLWFTSDISGSQMNNNGPYETFENNGLFVLIRRGPKAGKVIQLASAPIDAEFTGPCFSSDYRSLFLSVQHPGEQSPSLDRLTSHWPGGGNTIPRPSVVVIEGPLLDALVNLDQL